jgi:hypothetical protein
VDTRLLFNFPHDGIFFYNQNKPVGVARQNKLLHLNGSPIPISILILCINPSISYNKNFESPESGYDFLPTPAFSPPSNYKTSLYSIKPRKSILKKLTDILNVKTNIPSEDVELNNVNKVI